MTGCDSGATRVSQRHSAAQDATLREAPAPSTPSYRPSRPTIHTRQSSFAKRHASLDTPREIPLLKDWTNTSIVSQEAYPFPTANQPLSASPNSESPPSVATPSISAPRSTSNSSEDSTTSLPTLHPIATHISDLPGWLQSQDPHENSPLLFSDIEADEFPTKLMLSSDRPPSSHIPPPPSSPPLSSAFQLSPMPGRTKLRTAQSNALHNLKASGVVRPFLENDNSKQNPNFYEKSTSTTAISQPMPLQARRLSSGSQPTTPSAKRQSIGNKSAQSSEKKLQQSSVTPQNAQLKSCLKPTAPLHLTTAAAGMPQPALATSPSRELQQYVNQFVRSKTFTSKEEIPIPPSPPRILSFNATAKRIAPDLPLSPKNSPLSAEKNTGTTLSNGDKRHSAPSAVAPYEKFLAASGAPPPADSTIGRDIVVESKEKSYEIVVKLEGVGVEGITLTTRRPRTLVLSADCYHPTKGGHFERRIAFGSDADLGGKNGVSVKAEFDGVWLRVIVPRLTNRKEKVKASGLHDAADGVGRRNTVSH